MEGKEGQYETVPISDDACGDEWQSNTEVDESLPGDEKHRRWHATGLLGTGGGRSGRIGMASALQSWWMPVITILLLANMGLLLHISTRIQPRNSAGPRAAHQVGGDYTGEGPEFTTRTVKWDADFSFAPMNAVDFDSNKTLAKWNTIMPVGTGWRKPDQTFFTTTMTHQLHCVYMMGKMFAHLMIDQTAQHHTPLPNDYDTHYFHCVDYLRQAIMCAGDVATEAHEPTDGDDNGPLDGGWSGHHVCKDYGEVINYLEEQIASGVRTVLPIDD